MLGLRNAAVEVSKVADGCTILGYTSYPDLEVLLAKASKTEVEKTSCRMALVSQMRGLGHQPPVYKQLPSRTQAPPLLQRTVGKVREDDTSVTLC